MNEYDHMLCSGCFDCEACEPSGFGDDFDDAVTMPYMKMIDGKFISTDTQEIDVSDVEFV